MVREGERGERLNRHDGERPDAGAVSGVVTPERTTHAADGRREHPGIAMLLDCHPEAALVADSKRRVLIANAKLGDLLCLDPASLAGLRPGDAFRTGQSGAAGIVLEFLADLEPEPRECRIRRPVAGVLEPLDLKIEATPLPLDGAADYLLVTLRDVTDAKRRRVLERLFFHDAINVAGGLQGLTGLLEDSEGDEVIEIQREVHALAVQLVEEIQAHRDLAAAECGDLDVHFDEVAIEPLVRRLCNAYAHHHVAEGKHIEVGAIDGAAVLRTDELLLRRILGNLVKNALEAIRHDETVTVRYDGTTPGRHRFEVHNPGVMPAEVRMRMFQRSFTTKDGAGRGVGSYSVMLFAERYLGGRVEFLSDEQRGTVFVVELPARA